MKNLKPFFRQSSTITDYFAKLVGVVNKWVWNNEAVGSTPIFPYVRYKGMAILTDQEAEESRKERPDEQVSHITPTDFQNEQAENYRKLMTGINETKSSVFGKLIIGDY